MKSSCLQEKRFLSEKNVDERQAVFEQLEAYQAKVKYVNEQLSEVQTAIMEVDGSNKVRLWHILSTRDKEGLIEVVEERKKEDIREQWLRLTKEEEFAP